MASFSRIGGCMGFYLDEFCKLIEDELQMQEGVYREFGTVGYEATE